MKSKTVHDNKRNTGTIPALAHEGKMDDSNKFLTRNQVLHLLELGLDPTLQISPEKSDLGANLSTDQRDSCKAVHGSGGGVPHLQMQRVAVLPESGLTPCSSRQEIPAMNDEAQESTIRNSCGPLQTPLGIEAVLAKFYTDYAPAAAHGLEIQPQDYTQE